MREASIDEKIYITKLLPDLSVIDIAEKQFVESGNKVKVYDNIYLSIATCIQHDKTFVKCNYKGGAFDTGSGTDIAKYYNRVLIYGQYMYNCRTTNTKANFSNNRIDVLTDDDKYPLNAAYMYIGEHILVIVSDNPIKIKLSLGNTTGWGKVYTDSKGINYIDLNYNHTEDFAFVRF